MSIDTAAPAIRGARPVADGLILGWRNLKRIPRVPDLLLYGTIQPVMFVLLFAYVFGGSISVGGSTDPSLYREFLMGGIFAQTMSFAVASSSVGLADDMSKGLIDRFRSLPIARSAVITGRVIGDLVFNAFVMLIMVVCGLIVGWRIHTDALHAAGGFLILLGFAFAMLWVGALIGLSVRSPEVASSAGLIWLFPLTFMSNCFVDPSRMPGWMQPIAQWNPISSVTAACRDLFGNPNPFVGSGFTSQHPVLLAVLWLIAITAVFAPLAIRKYQRAAAR
ncbi:MAG: ABC transporter permease [Nocardioidaceae bacterium]